jgi:hypothetical protein
MKYIKTIVKSVINNIIPKASPKPVGRWSIEECNVKMNTRVDLSNEDHCGPCGQYALAKIEKIEEETEKKALTVQHDQTHNNKHQNEWEKDK